MSPRISVVMPNLNNAPYIVKAIDSVLGQTFGDLELIIVDNGSTDESREIAESYAQTDNRVRLIDESKRGLPQAFNRGVDEARGEFIAELDGDDVYHPEKLFKQLTVMESTPQIGVCYTDGWTMDESGASTGAICSRKTIGTSPAFERGELFSLLLKKNFILGGSMMLRASALGGTRFDENAKYAPDWDFWVRLARRTAFRCVEEPLYGYRVHGQAMSSFRHTPRNAWHLTRLMVKWSRELDLTPAERLHLAWYAASGPVRLTWVVFHRAVAHSE